MKLEHVLDKESLLNKSRTWDFRTEQNQSNLQLALFGRPAKHCLTHARIAVLSTRGCGADLALGLHTLQ